MSNPKIGNVNYEIQAHSDFYFYFLSLTKIEFSKEVDTAGLKLESIDYKIVINPDFWSSIATADYKKNQFLLLHELYHLIFKHYIIYKDYDDFDLFNIASDAYINYELIQLVFQDNSYFIESGVDYRKIGVPEYIVREGTDTVYNYLKSSNDPNFKQLYSEVSSKNNIFTNGHESWKSLSNSSVSSEVLAKTIEAQVESQIKEASEYSKNIGSLPVSLNRLIHSILNRKESKIDWRKELGKFISLFSNRIFVKKSYTKPSKFFEDATTLKVKFKPKIAVILDTSGSMREEDLIEAFSELTIISKKSEYDIKVIETDCEISKDSIYDFVNINTLSSRLEQKGVLGGGGTSVDPAIEYINKNLKDVASIIYITDGYVDSPEIKPLKPFIVVLSSSGRPLDSFKKLWNNNFKTIKIEK